MPRVVAVCSQCRSRFGDRAPMRLRPAFRPLISSPLIYRRQEFHRSSTARGKEEPTIFEDSLEKTLQIHRSSNRESLIRRVPSRIDFRGNGRATTVPDEASEKGSQNRSLRLDAQRHGSSDGLVHDTNDVPANNEARVVNYPTSVDESEPSDNNDTVVRGTEARIDMPSQDQSPKSSRLSSGTKLKTGTLHKQNPSPEKASPWHVLLWDVNLNRGREEQCPWLDYMTPNEGFSTGVSQLEEEIKVLETLLLPTVLEQKRVDQIISDVSDLLKDAVPISPQVIGSRRTGLAMTHSGLDFMLPVTDPKRSAKSIRKPSPTRPKMLQLYRKSLDRVAVVLQKCSTYGSVELWGQHTLKAIHRPTGLRLIFYCGEGVPASVEYTRDFCAEYPLIRTLYLITRLILETKEVFGGYKYSLSADALVMLIAAFFKMNHGRFHRDGGCSKPLLAFLHTFGIEVNLSSTGVAVDPPGLFDADTMSAALETYGDWYLPAHLRGQLALLNRKKNAAARHNIILANRLCLQDPANYLNDLGRSCIRTRQVQATFARAFRNIEWSLRLWKPRDNLDLNTSILNSALHANFDGFFLRRDLLR